MQDLIKQEQFELEVLDKLNSRRLLSGLVFVGGTMLRLCYGLNRFSVDLDFWAVEKNISKVFDPIKECLGQSYKLTDAADKHFTMLFEIRSAGYPRSLKIEIRKGPKLLSTEQAIAFSVYASTQVKLNVLSLKEMMSAKIAALLERRQIRDAFDMEFFLRKGIRLDIDGKQAKKALGVIEGFKKNDYKVVLGVLLDGKERAYYSKEGFKLLRGALSEIASG
jgi:predicted nucleotidyltransferase component of viral defense system